MAIINGRGRVGIRRPSAVSALILDTYSGAAVAYSLRKLSNTYSGSLIRVRRSSDNTEQNIGFDASGNLDTTALTSFVGAGNGFVTTWYDQSGNGRNATQTTAGGQPQIVSSGVVLTANSKPSLLFNGSSHRMPFTQISSTGGMEAFCVCNFNSVAGGGSVWDVNAPIQAYTGGFIQDFAIGAKSSKVAIYTENNNSISLTTTTTISTGISFLCNGYGSTTSTGVGFNNSNYVVGSATRNDLIVRALGQDSGSLFYNGKVSEIVLYPIVQTANRSNINTSINTYYSIYPVVSDSDAQSFVSAAGLTSSVQANAVNTLVASLKSAGIWTKMKAVYPFVGGSAASHKFNLKDPRDLDAAFRLAFTAGWVHSSTGALPNGTSDYANTFLNAVIVLLENNRHLAHYSKTQVINTNSHDMGSESVPDKNFDLYQYYSAVNSKGFLDGIYPANANQINNTNTLGLLIGSRTASNLSKIYFNNTLIDTNINSKVTISPNYNVYIGATNRMDIAGAFSSKQVAFSSIGDGLTDAEASSLYTAVQTYQTALGRQV